MNERIRHILNQITSLEDDLRAALHEQETRLHYQIHDKRIEFEQSVKSAHHKLKLGIFRWFGTVPPQNFLTAPFIYSLIIPLMVLDAWVSIYQAICFPVYGIPKCHRVNYIRFDHQHLAYLNAIEKVHCLYCSYASGLIAYTLEITARTELYFCPIKHANKILGTHSRYAQFLDYGEADYFHSKLEQLRSALAEEMKQASAPYKY